MREEDIQQDDKLKELTIEFRYFRNDIDELKKGQKETNAKLEIMKEGYVGREEFKNFQATVGKLAAQKDLDILTERVKKLEDNQSRLVWIVLTAVIIAILGTVIVTR